MAIDVFSEKVVRLIDVNRLLPRRPHKNLHVSTMYRWILRGLRSRDGVVVRLESVKIGGTTFTSQEALQRFFDRLSGDEAIITPPTLTNRQRRLQIEQAEEELKQFGI